MSTPTSPNAPFRLAVLRDFREEQWPSMDLVADRLLEELRRDPAGRFIAEDICPVFSRSVSRLPFFGRRGAAINFERLWNRQWRYPRFARRLESTRSFFPSTAAAERDGSARNGGWDFYHICDHSYAQLVHWLPAERTGVFCHDLDTFRCLLSPHREPRPTWFRAMARRTLRGLEKAAIVFYTTEAIRAQILRHGLVDARRLVKTPLGVAEEFTPLAPPDQTPSSTSRPFILHVGSCIERKRIDVLLDVFARLQRDFPQLQLVQVGGQWSGQQRRQIEARGIAAHLVQRRGVPNRELAQLYRTARLVLQTSQAEGFGLPVAEALACGSVVIASDIPVLREVGGPAALYCRAADVPAWSALAAEVLSGAKPVPALQARVTQAARYTWREYARTIASAYEKLAQTTPSANGALAPQSVFPTHPHFQAGALPTGGIRV